MNHHSVVACIALSALVFACRSAWAQDDIVTYGASEPMNVDGPTTARILQLRRDSNRVDVVRVNFACLANQLVTLNLPDGVRLRFKQRARTSASSEGADTWVGMLESGDYGTATFAKNSTNTRMCGSIHVLGKDRERTLQLTSLDDSTHVLVELNLSKCFTSCGHSHTQSR